MTVQRVIAIVAVLSVPAVCAPALVRSRGTVPPSVWLLAATVVCLIPVSAPWFSVGMTTPVVIWLIGIAGRD